MGIEQSRRDDLEAVGYVFMYFKLGKLPWQGLGGKDKKEKYEKIMEVKFSTPVENLCKNSPKEFGVYLDYCRNLRFEDKPGYDYLRRLMQDLATRESFRLDDSIFDWTSYQNASAPVEQLKSRTQEMLAKLKRGCALDPSSYGGSYGSSPPGSYANREPGRPGSLTHPLSELYSKSPTMFHQSPSNSQQMYNQSPQNQQISHSQSKWSPKAMELYPLPDWFENSQNGNSASGNGGKNGGKQPPKNAHQSFTNAAHQSYQSSSNALNALSPQHVIQQSPTPALSPIQHVKSLGVKSHTESSHGILRSNILRSGSHNSANDSSHDLAQYS